MASTPTPKNVRLTISVTPEVHAVFQRMANSMGMSISKAMGDWLGDTLEAAEFMALTVEKARSAPGVLVKEMHAYALGLTDETTALMDQFRAESGRVRGDGGVRAASLRPRAPAPTPPSSNTGGKGQGQSRSKGGKVS